MPSKWFGWKEYGFQIVNIEVKINSRNEHGRREQLERELSGSEAVYCAVLGNK